VDKPGSRRCPAGKLKIFAAAIADEFIEERDFAGTASIVELKSSSRSSEASILFGRRRAEGTLKPAGSVVMLLLSLVRVCLGFRRDQGNFAEIFADWIMCRGSVTVETTPSQKRLLYNAPTHDRQH
jgi:hypothetical protein